MRPPSVPNDEAAVAPAGFAAVVLAAGQSSRMGSVKALATLGGRSALERVASTLAAAGVTEIVVVTGYHAERLDRELERLGLRAAHNPSPQRGMFSSVQTGVAALAPSPEAFLVLPVDYALLRPEVLASLVQDFAAEGADVLHPCCAGLRGHPPLLSGRLRAPLVAAPADTDLRAFLAEHALRVGETAVEDLTILLDMDTPGDLERMRRFATFLDAPDPGAAPPGDHLTEADALYVLTLLQTPERAVAHCRAVAAVGEALAAALEAKVRGLDVALVRSACLLHDMVRGQGARKHAVMAERILGNLGLPRLAAVVGAHMVLPLDPGISPLPTEEELVYLADKMVVEDRAAGLREREEHALAKHGGDSMAIEGLGERMRRARVIADKCEAITGRSLLELIPHVSPVG